MMPNLETTHPWLYRLFAVEGLFVIRHNDRVSAGIWPDLTIEQVMMKSLKSKGGLTHGKGLTEGVRTLWVYSMHASASYQDSMSSLTKQKNETSHQHAELGQSRMRRDHKDLQKVMEWFEYETHNPFDPKRTSLQSLITGMIADESINCDDAERIGHMIQLDIDGQSVSNATIKRSD